MPCRLLREGILSSERVNRLGCEAEVFYRRLMSVVDDYGRFHAHPALLRAALYPLRLDTVVDAEIQPLLQEAEAAGLVHTYAVGGKRYVQMLDFRQQVRAKQSKYPAPPGECTPAAQHLPGKGAASAHLDEGEGVGVDVFESGGGGEGALPQQPPAAHAAAENANSAAPLPVQIAVKLREQGVDITSTHPLAAAWAAAGISLAQLQEAVAIARLRKPQGRIPPNYLAPIVEEMRNPPAPAKGAGQPAWWASEAATLTQGRALGVHPNPGEAMGEYRARISRALSAPGQATPPAQPPGPQGMPQRVPQQRAAA